MTTRDLDKLKKKLPKGYSIMLWKRLNKYSVSAINRVLRGDYQNNIIIDEAIRLAEEHQAELKGRSEKISLL
jgi:nitrous oxidase accessory protein NosD